MKDALRLLIAAFSAAFSISFALATGGCSKGALTPGSGSDGGEPSALACASAADCTHTEIDHEITAAADCICLYGCPFAIVNVVTADRRMSQYAAHCTPNPMNCGVDDCALPPPVACINQQCAPLPMTP
jgi:hypothetical protein